MRGAEFVANKRGWYFPKGSRSSLIAVQALCDLGSVANPKVAMTVTPISAKSTVRFRSPGRAKGRNEDPQFLERRRKAVSWFDRDGTDRRDRIRQYVNEQEAKSK